MRRLFIDIETSPNLVFSWRTGSRLYVDHSNIVKERAIICVCWKWEGEEKVQHAMWDRGSDEQLVKVVVGVLNQADEIVGHNVEGFDLPWIRTRAMYYGVTTNPAYKTIDTLQVAKRRMYLNSNKLGYIAQYLGIGSKIETKFDLWKDIALKNSGSALKEMLRYCRQDVVLLEKVYQKLSYHVAAKSHRGVMEGGEKWNCPHCGSVNVKLEKHRITAAGNIFKQMQCQKCGRYYQICEKAYNDYQGEVMAKKKKGGKCRR